MGLPREIESRIKQRVALVLGGVISGQSWSQIHANVNLRGQIYEIIVGELLSTDPSTIGRSLLDVVSDGSVTSEELREIVQSWALAQAGGDQVLKDLIQALSDDKLTAQEVAAVSLTWAKRQATEPRVKAFLSVVVTGSGGLSVDPAKAKELLIAYLGDRSGLPASVTKPIADAVKAGTFKAEQFFAIVAGWATASGEDRLADLLRALSEQGQSTGDALLVLASWLSDVPKDDLQQVLELIAQKKFTHLAALIVGSLGDGLGISLLRQVLEGKFEEAAEKALGEFLKKAGVNEFDDLAKALVDLATGARSLFARPETETLPFGNNAAAVAVWHETQEVMYFAQLFVGDAIGGIVSTDPQAVPHLIRASALKFNTPLSNLVADPSKKPQREEVVDTLTLMLDRHFRGRIIPFGNSRVLAEKDFRAGSNINCGSVVAQVFARWIGSL